jgi:large subunit ribosomal protein L13
MYKTHFVAKEKVDQKWWLVDAADKRLGRLATEISKILRGKHKPDYTPNSKNGDFVVVINAEKIQMTGSKWTDKKYYRHSRFFGSLKERSAQEVLAQDPCFIITEAVRGMLPTNKLNYEILSMFKPYAGAEHPHQAQKPQALEIGKN